MFKLVKIEGSGTNQPDPIRVIADPSVKYKKNHAYKLIDGILLNLEGVDKPTFIAAENLEPGKKSTVLAYRIQDNMIFEVPGLGGYFAPGMNYCLKLDSEGAAYGIRATTTDGIFMVIDNNGFKKSGDKVYGRVTEEIYM